jgi:Ser/Thr protein kinase RdoA (MazF antagonist)
LASPAPPEPEIRTAIGRALIDDYHIKGELSRLPGENLNYLVVAEKGENYVAKIAADDQPESFVEMEFFALRHAARALNRIRLPQIYENKDGNAETYLNFSDNNHKRLRIISYLSGELLENIDISAKLRREVGVALAKFDQAMADFDHPAAHRPHRWDLTRATQHEGNVRLISNPARKELLGWAYAQYKNINTGKIKQVKWQFIHGDTNPENILVEDDTVTGLLDFGDSCHNPRICELAICRAAKPIIEGYESVLPLTDLEHELLGPLVLGRLATTLSIATQRRQIEPDHPNWFVSEEPAWHLLAQLRQLPEFTF